MYKIELKKRSLGIGWWLNTGNGDSNGKETWALVLFEAAIDWDLALMPFP